MNVLSSVRPLSGASPLVHTTEVTRNCALALARAIDDQIDPPLGAGNSQQAGYVLLAQARAAITATRMPLPSWLPECAHHARLTGLDIVLLRNDRARGMSVDILPADSSEPMCGYRVWNGASQHLWFIPTAGFTPFVRATRWGLFQEVAPPFGSDADRDAGMIMAAPHCSLAGSF